MRLTVKKHITILLSSVALCATLGVSAQPVLSTTHVDVLCNGANTGSIDLTISAGLFPYYIQWSNGLQTEDLSNLAAGVYTVSVTDYNGDTASTSVTISEETAVVLTAGQDYSFCEGRYATLSCNATGGTAPYSFIWLCNSDECGLSSNTVQNPEARPTHTRVYYMFATDANGCSSNMDSLTVNVNRNPDLILTNDTTIYLGESIQLIVSPGYHNTFTWSPETYLDNSTIFSPTSTPEEDIIYEVAVMSDSGCWARDSVRITVDSVPTPNEHIVNNLFTPNGDGSNDFWSVHTKGDVPVDVVVFNRWGTEVYSQKNYQDDWDGTSNGEPLPEATYYYVITVRGEDEKLSGPVSIVRLR